MKVFMAFFRQHTPSLMAALILLVCSPIALATDTYIPATKQLTMASVTIGNATYTNMVVIIGNIVSGPTGTEPNSIGDTYNAATGLLVVSTVKVESTAYFNAVVTVQTLVSIGSVTGADSYDGTYLRIPSVQLTGGAIYNNVVITVGSVVNSGGGMPKYARDVYNPINMQLTIASIQLGSNIYTNVVVTLGQLVSASIASPPTVILSVSPIMVAAGQQATLSWSSTNATGCTGSGSWSGSRSTSGTALVASSTTPGYYTYAVTCSGNGTPAAQSVILTAYGPLVAKTTITSVGSTAWYEPTVYVPPPNYIVGMTSNTTVLPTSNTSANTNQYWNYWIGLDPAPANYGTINNGVLQPVLSDFSPYVSWYASSVYDNDSNPNGTANITIVEGQQSAYYDQIDGDDSFGSYHNFAPNPGDSFTMSIAYDSTSQNWTVIDDDTTINESNTLIVNLSGQQQNYAYLALEIDNGMSINYSPVWTNTVITFAQPDTTGICSNALGEGNAYTMTPPQLDGTKTICTIGQVIAPHP